MPPLAEQGGHLSEKERRKWIRKSTQLFSKYDKGCRLSDEMLYSVTPEKVARKTANLVARYFPDVTTVIDACGGAGGNTIAFALAGYHTMYVDINEDNFECAQINASIYDCSSDIWFELGDALAIDYSDVCLEPKSTLLFASPEWGGPSYKASKIFDVEKCIPATSSFLQKAKENEMAGVCLYLPRTSNIEQLGCLGCTRITYMFLKGWCCAICAWWNID